MERLRLKKRFEYVPRDPGLLKRRLQVYRARSTRLGLEPRKKPKPLSGADALLRKLKWLEWSRRQVEGLELDLDRFLDERPRLRDEYHAFLALGGRTLGEFSNWLRQAAKSPASRG
jgi:hypothetical protein